MASINSKSFLVAGLGQLRMTVFSLDVGHMPNGVRQSRSIARCTIDGDRFLVTPQGRVAMAHVTVNLTETSQRPGKIDGRLGFAIKTHCLDQMCSCIGQSVLSSRLKSQVQQFVGAVGHIACQVNTGNGAKVTDGLLAHQLPMLVVARN